MKIKIEINCDNAAFEDNWFKELDDILVKANSFLKKHYDYGQIDSDRKNLFDSNGNKVGFVLIDPNN